jgi:hypothetical protein
VSGEKIKGYIMEKFYLGSQIPVVVSIEPIGGIHLENLPFTCEFWATGGCVEIKKEEMVRVDADSYRAIVDSNKTGLGIVHNLMRISVPDSQAEGGMREEPVLMDDVANVIGYGLHKCESENGKA